MHVSVLPPRCATAPHSAARPALHATGIKINDGVRGRGRGAGTGGVGRGEGAVHMCKHVDVRQRALLAFEGVCAPFPVPSPLRFPGFVTTFGFVTRFG